MTYRKRVTYLMFLDSLIVLTAIYVSNFVLLPYRAIFTIPLLISSITLLTSHHIFAYRYKLYKRVWEYASIGELIAIFKAVSLSIVVTAVVQYFVINNVYIRTLAITWMMHILLIGGSRFSWRMIRDNLLVTKKEYKKRALIIGAGAAGTMVARQLLNNNENDLLPVGFIDDDKIKHQLDIMGIPVYGGIDHIEQVVEQLSIDNIILAIPSLGRSELNRIFQECTKTEAKTQIMPKLEDLMVGKVSVKQFRNVEVEDLLGREPVKLDTDNIDKYVKDDVAEDTIAEHPKLDNALSSNLSIGIDDLLAIKDRLNPKVDPGNKARNALVSAVLKSIQEESPANSGGNAGGGGGGGGVISQPSTDVNVTDNATGVTVKPEITKSQDATTGQSVAKATIDEASVLKALETSKKTVNIQIDVTEDADTAVAELGANFITKLTENNLDNTMTINSKQGSTAFPVKELNNVLQAYKNAGEDISTARVAVSFGKAAQTEKASIEGAVVNEGAKTLTPAFVMNATVTVGEKVHQIKNFSSYVQSTITLEQTLNPSRVVGLQLVSNNESVAAKAKVRASSLQGEVVAVPTLIKTKDGKTTIIVKQRSSAPVMIVENNKSFNDVPNTFWAKNDIDLLASKMLVKGREKDQYAPQGKVTRAEFATMLVRALGLSAEETYDFKDVQTDTWYAGTVGAAYKAEIVSGMGEQTFKPNEKITRQQAAAMLINAMEFLGKDIDLTKVEVTEQNARFNDASQVQAWAKDSVVKSAKVGIFGGDDKNNFNPQADTTRSESAAILKRLMKEMELISE